MTNNSYTLLCHILFESAKPAMNSSMAIAVRLSQMLGRRLNTRTVEQGQQHAVERGWLFGNRLTMDGERVLRHAIWTRALL